VVVGVSLAEAVLHALETLVAIGPPALAAPLVGGAAFLALPLHTGLALLAGCFRVQQVLATDGVRFHFALSTVVTHWRRAFGTQGINAIFALFAR